MPQAKLRDCPMPSVVAPDHRAVILRRDVFGRSAQISVRFRRLVELEKRLVGTSAAEALRLLRRQVPLTGWAPGLACLTALELATGRALDPGTARARALLAQAEIGAGLACGAGLNWPRLLGMQERLSVLRYARTATDALAARLWQGSDPFEPSVRPSAPAEAEPAVSAVIEAVEMSVLPRAPADPDRLAEWAGRDAAPLARLIRAASRVHLNRPISRGAAVPDLVELEARMAREAGFDTAPHVAGGPGDPTPYARLPEVPGAARFGPVGARLLAQAARAQAMVEGLARLDPPPIVAFAPRAGVGAALVETMLGPLAVRIACDRDGRISAFASLLPAQWLVHRLGPLVTALSALQSDRFLQDAPLVLAAHDPGSVATLRHDPVRAAH